MKDAEFMELLNLYLDHEISAADAARLEAEVQANPARRAIYRDYCRMQKGCSLLATTAESRVAAEGQGALRASESSAQRDRRMIMPIFAWGGGALLAAACLALVFLGIRQNTAHTASGTIAASDVSTGNPAATPVVPKQGGLISVAGQQMDAHRVTLVSNSLTLSRTSPAGGMFAPVATNPMADRLAWMRDMHLVSVSDRIQRDEMRFNAATSPLRPDLRQLQIAPQSPEQPASEVAAFRFTR